MLGPPKARRVDRPVLVSLEDLVPADDFYRHLERVVDLAFVRDLVLERTAAGLAAARARGRKGGRPPVMTPEKAALARQLYDARQHPVATIATTLGVSRASVYRALEAPPASDAAPPAPPARPRARGASRRRRRGPASPPDSPE